MVCTKWKNEQQNEFGRFCAFKSCIILSDADSVKAVANGILYINYSKMATKQIWCSQYVSKTISITKKIKNK